MDLSHLTREVMHIANDAADFIRANVGKVTAFEAEVKSENSLVSYVDKTAEKMLVDKLNILLPEAGFITEEDTVNNSSDPLVWVIDPLDGTTNFLQGIPVFSVSVALKKDDDYLLGVVVDVMQKDTYHAHAGGGAFCNEGQIRTSKTSKLHEAVIATGFPYDSREELPELVSILNTFLRSTRGIRRLGSAALDMTYVASGKMDLFYETTLNLWDIAAGVVLVREAGGQVMDFMGNQITSDATRIIAGNGHLDMHALDVIRKHYYGE